MDGDLDGPIVFLTGPTAAGKSGLALTLTRAFPLEIVNADSVQVYRELSIGTAKPTLSERESVPHHLWEVADPWEVYSAERYREAVLTVIAGCRLRGTIPLLVGGSGLYLRAVASGLARVPTVPPEVLLQVTAEGEESGWPRLHVELQRGDPELAARVFPGDRQRIRRGVAVLRATGTPLSVWWRMQPPPPAWRLLKMAVSWPPEALRQRIDVRFDRMMAEGLLAEALVLYQRGYDPGLPAMKAVGYRQLFAHLRGELTLEAAVAQAKLATWHYARRQLTWLRREPGLVWLSSPDPVPDAVARMRSLLSAPPMVAEARGG